MIKLKCKPRRCLYPGTGEKETSNDRISELPDCILLHIMSFLTTKEVIKTCLLSKRWEFLWTHISEINLLEESTSKAKLSRFVDMVGKMLRMCNGIHLNKFAVDFQGGGFDSNIDLWVEFLVKNKVKHISLCTHSCNKFVIPRKLYTHSSMLSLTISYCFLNLGAIRWGSLKSLDIEGVTFRDNVIEEILSGSPVLEVLRISDFWGYSYLNINTRTLATLIIERWHIHDYEHLEISAPYVHDLSIVSTDSYKFRLGNVSSVIRAKLDLGRHCVVKHDDLPNVTDYIKQSLESLKSVKELELGPWCMRILSVLEIEGWQFPTSTIESLTLHVYMDKKIIPGILGILKSSPKLETLVIKGILSHNLYKYNVPVRQAEAYLQNDGNMELVLSYLKTINITTFIDNACFMKSELSTDFNNPISTLVQILFKGAMVLEKLVISMKDLDITELAMALANLPRGSPSSVIQFDS